MQTQLNHEQLTVYQRALALCMQAERLSTVWRPKHAVSDHLPRAAEGIVESLAQACAASGKAKLSVLDYALGSTLECAACLDVAKVREMPTTADCETVKGKAFETFCMLFGLRKSWGLPSVHETNSTYKVDGTGATFHHERLDVYQLGLDVVRGVSHFDSSKLPPRVVRKFDALSTSVVLNIAEGNGRYSMLDHHRFLLIAYRSAIKLATQLDLCVCRGNLTAAEIATPKNMLTRVAGMTTALAGWRSDARGIDEVDDKVDDKGAPTSRFGQDA
jgi:four helix bundle protein